jgi:hypothetical protein
MQPELTFLGVYHEPEQVRPGLERGKRRNGHLVVGCWRVRIGERRVGRKIGRTGHQFDLGIDEVGRTDRGIVIDLVWVKSVFVRVSDRSLDVLGKLYNTVAA